MTNAHCTSIAYSYLYRAYWLLFISWVSVHFRVAYPKWWRTSQS